MFQFESALDFVAVAQDNEVGFVFIRVELVGDSIVTDGKTVFGVALWAHLRVPTGRVPMG